MSRDAPPPAGDPETLRRYQRDAVSWRDRRAPDHHASAAFGRDVRSRHDGPFVDIGCGPGWFTPHLGPDTIALDATPAMLDLVAEHAPGHPRILADATALPFRNRSISGALACKVYVHLPRSQVPAALADLHRSLRVDAEVDLVVFGDEPAEAIRFDDDDFPGRLFSTWDRRSLTDTIVGAGFEITDWRHRRPQGAAVSSLRIRLRRLATLPDTVGADLHLLLCGLNPSLHSADAGVGFVSPSNRFWPAALASGLVTRDRDPRHALHHHRVGMTDLVKRATPRASELTRHEYRDGLERIGRQVEWLAPRAICFVGLAGWRAVADPRAVPGWQGVLVGGAPVYLMPSTSGLNASSRLPDLVAHLEAACREPE